MGIFSGIQHAFIVLIFVFDLGRNELYPSIQWTALNPIFKSNKTQCVHPMSKLIFVCPNTATAVTKLASSSLLRPLYENLWLVSRQSYERCELNQATDNELILCDNPFNLKYYMAIFKKYSASLDPKFEPGKDYYFIATSNGKQSSIKSTSGGHCKTQNMKLKFHICMNSEDPRCQSEDTCNGVTPTTHPQTTAKTKNTSARSRVTKNTSSRSRVNYTVPNTPTKGMKGPGHQVLEEKSTYLITIGCLVFTCVFLLIFSIILICQLCRKRKATSIASRDSTSLTIRINDCPDGDWD